MYKLQNDRQYIWIHELIHARAAYLNKAENIYIIVKREGDTTYGNCYHTLDSRFCGVVRTAPYYILSEYNLLYNGDYELNEAKRVKTWKRYRNHRIISQIVFEFDFHWELMNKCWQRSYLDINEELYARLDKKTLEKSTLSSGP